MDDTGVVGRETEEFAWETDQAFHTLIDWTLKNDPIKRAAAVQAVEQLVRPLFLQIKDSDARNDLLQEVQLTVWKRPLEFYLGLDQREDGVTARMWILGVASNLRKKYFRQTARQEVPFDPLILQVSERTDPDQNPARLSTLLREFVTQLTPAEDKLKAVAELYLRDLTTTKAEAARELGIDESTVRERLDRLGEMLNRWLSRQGAR